MVQKNKGELTWSCLTCSWSACWVLAAICDACRSLVEHRCFSPSISSVQYLCLSSNSWQVSASFSSKLTCCMVNTAQQKLTSLLFSITTTSTTTSSDLDQESVLFWYWYLQLLQFSLSLQQPLFQVFNQ